MREDVKWAGKEPHVIYVRINFFVIFTFQIFNNIEVLYSNLDHCIKYLYYKSHVRSVKVKYRFLGAYTGTFIIYQNIANIVPAILVF